MSHLYLSSCSRSRFARSAGHFAALCGCCFAGWVGPEYRAIWTSSNEIQRSEDDIQQSICNSPVSGYSKLYVLNDVPAFCATPPHRFRRCKSMSDLECRSTGDVSFVPEQPPEGLHLEFRYTSGGIMSKYDIWSAVLESMAAVALSPWNAQIIGALTIPVDSEVEIRFVSSVNPPRFQSKTILWSMVEVFDFYNTQKRYSNCFLTTYNGRGPAAQILGVASIKSTLSSNPGLQPNSSALSLSNQTSVELEVPTLGLSPSAQASANQSRLSHTNPPIFRSDSQTMTGLQAGTLHLFLEYLNPGALISDKGFVTLMMNIIVFAAQHDPKNAPCGLVRSYNSAENYTFAIGPTSDAARDKLPWTIAVSAVGYLPAEMMKHGRNGRWAELTARIKWNGAWVGKILIIKGDHRPASSSLCETL